MIRAVLIDDETRGLRSLELLIKKYCPEVMLVAMSKEAAEGIDLINTHQPDVVFLDINMPKMNGFEMLERLKFREFQLVFTTAHEEYALRALKKRAIDYLLKPISGTELKEAMEKVKKKVGEKRRSLDLFNLLKELKDAAPVKIPIQTKYGVEIIATGDIVYVEADSNNSLIVLANANRLLSLRPLKEHEAALCAESTNFIRIHNSYLINLNYVRRYVRDETAYVIMEDGKRIPVSRQKKDEFLAMIRNNRSENHP